MAPSPLQLSVLRARVAIVVAAVAVAGSYAGARAQLAPVALVCFCVFAGCAVFAQWQYREVVHAGETSLPESRVARPLEIASRLLILTVVVVGLSALLWIGWFLVMYFSHPVW